MSGVLDSLVKVKHIFLLTIDTARLVCECPKLLCMVIIIIIRTWGRLVLVLA